MQEKKDIKDYLREELEVIFKEKGFPSFSTQQIFEWTYKKRVEDFNWMTNLSNKVKQFLKENFYFSQLKLLKREVSCDGTEKFLFALEDSSCIETVLIPEGKRTTLCISTQVGCKFACKFCLSGKGGFKRNLSTPEIVNQYLNASQLITPHKITNIVFMGIGEPLDNFYNTIKATKIFMEPKGLYFGKRRICISTCGLTPQIRELNRLNLGVKLSISLHSADNNLRTKLMPINKKYPLKELIKSAKEFSTKNRCPVTFEYILIRELNTSKGDVHRLVKLLGGMNYKINLIPLNCSYSAFQPPTEEEINEFKEELKKRGVFFTLRKPRGRDINAACGQLRALYNEKVIS
jgi:23S rRNA (adenine2503-C2)-methyltransferase